MRQRFIAFVAVLLLVGCTGEPQTIVSELNGKTMGTTWSVKIAHPENAPVSSAAQGQIEALLVEVNNQMSTWQKDSEVTLFNAEPAPYTVEVSAPHARIVTAALELSQQTDGKFDPTIGPVVNLWGFGPPRKENRLPTDEEVEQARAQVGFEAISVEGMMLSKSADRRLDLSAIAKGHGVDVVADHLTSMGYPNHLVEIGGEMRAGGNKGPDGAWRVAIEKPVENDRAIQTVIPVSDIGIATSGDYRNYREIAGQKFHHAMDPDTGLPVEHDLGSVTVLHPSAALADGWATALLVIGADKGLELAEQKGLAAYFIRRGDQGLRAEHTTAFAPYLEATQ